MSSGSAQMLAAERCVDAESVHRLLSDQFPRRVDATGGPSSFRGSPVGAHDVRVRP